MSPIWLGLSAREPRRHPRQLEVRDRGRLMRGRQTAPLWGSSARAAQVAAEGWRYPYLAHSGGRAAGACRIAYMLR